MISVSFQAGCGFIYNAEDWLELRTKHRIISEIFGNTKTSQLALPGVLSPEQIYLLIKIGAITLIKSNKIIKEPTADDKLKFDNEIKEYYEEQKTILREERKNQIDLYVDKIIKGKQLENVSREDIIQEELNKLPALEFDNIIAPIFTQHPNFLSSDFSIVPLSEVLEHTTRIKCLVFENLWNKKYFITSGRKFGGDFLVYLGDPVLFHAIYIVKCVENSDHLLNATEIVALGRLGHSVKKKFVLANVDENNQVSYITIDWFDIE